jgi:hypothetical protein
MLFYWVRVRVRVRVRVGEREDPIPRFWIEKKKKKSCSIFWRSFLIQNVLLLRRDETITGGGPCANPLH